MTEEPWARKLLSPDGKLLLLVILLLLFVPSVSLFKVPIISATSTTIKDGLQKKEVTFRREVESNPK